MCVCVCVCVCVCAHARTCMHVCVVEMQQYVCVRLKLIIQINLKQGQFFEKCKMCALKNHCQCILLLGLNFVMHFYNYFYV